MTVRCARAQFRLRPDETRRAAFGFYLGRALEAHPGIELCAAVQMSNHLHLVVVDRSSELSGFMCRFLGPLAKVLNGLDGTRGQVFERRYAATEIVDDAALLDCITYVVTNPEAAGLVRTDAEWPGLLLDPRGQREERFERVRSEEYARAVASAAARGDGETVAEADFTDVAWVRVGGVLEAEEVADLAAHVLARRAKLRAAREGRPVLGARRVVQEDVFSAPAHPKRSPMPLCHASTGDLWLAFREGWRRFVWAYRAASAAFREGDFGTVFPDFSFRPWTPPL